MKAVDSTPGKMLKVRNTKVYNGEAPLGSGKPLCSQQETKSTLSHTGLNHKLTPSHSCGREFGHFSLVPTSSAFCVIDKCRLYRLIQSCNTGIKPALLGCANTLHLQPGNWNRSRVREELWSQDTSGDLVSHHQLAELPSDRAESFPLDSHNPQVCPGWAPPGTKLFPLTACPEHTLLISSWSYEKKKAKKKSPSQNLNQQTGRWNQAARWTRCASVTSGLIFTRQLRLRGFSDKYSSKDTHNKKWVRFESSPWSISS